MSEKQETEMVERVALAIMESYGCEDGACGLRACVVDHCSCRQVARQAIAAMRDPTTPMLEAGDSMMPQIASGQDISTGYDALKDAWPAMVDAALGKGVAA